MIHNPTTAARKQDHVMMPSTQAGEMRQELRVNGHESNTQMLTEKSYRIYSHCGDRKSRSHMYAHLPGLVDFSNLRQGKQANLEF